MFDSFFVHATFFFFSMGKVPEKNDNVLSIEKKRRKTCYVNNYFYKSIWQK